MNLSLKNGWGLFIGVVAGLAMNIAILQGMEHKGEIPGESALSLRPSRNLVQSDIRGIAELSDRFKQINIEVRPEATYSMLPDELDLAIATQLIPTHVIDVKIREFHDAYLVKEFCEPTIKKREREIEKLANAFEDISCLAGVDRKHHALLQDKTIQHKLFSIIPSDKMLHEVIVELKRRRSKSEAEYKKEKFQISKYFQESLNQLKDHIKIFERGRPSEFQNRIAQMLEMGVNPNFVIKDKNLLGYAILGHDEDALDVLIQHDADLFPQKNSVEGSALQSALKYYPPFALLLLEKYNVDPTIPFRDVPLDRRDHYCYVYPREWNTYWKELKKVIQIFIERGMDPNSAIQDGQFHYPLLTWAMWIIKYSDDKKLDLIEQLIKAEVNPNLTYINYDEKKVTPLEDFPEVLSLLRGNKQKEKIEKHFPEQRDQNIETGEKEVPEEKQETREEEQSAAAIPGPAPTPDGKDGGSCLIV